MGTILAKKSQGAKGIWRKSKRGLRNADCAPSKRGDLFRL
jgi:hypothetical protein